MLIYFVIKIKTLSKNNQSGGSVGGAWVCGSSHTLHNHEDPTCKNPAGKTLYL